MENQPMEQSPTQPTEQPAGEVAAQSSSHLMLYIVGAVVVIALVAGYFLLQSSAPATDNSATESQALLEQAAAPAFTTGNTTADISADLDQIPDTSTALDADVTAAAKDLQSL